MLPLVVSLKGRIGSSVISSLNQSFTRYCQSPHVILNLEAVDSVETSVAECIQGRAERILQRDASLFSIVVSRSQSGVKSDLERSKLNYSYDLATPPATSDSESTNRKQLRAYETLEHAIRDARYGYQSSPCFLPEKLDLSLIALCEATLHQHTSRKQQLTISDLRSAGKMVRELECGDTIACSEYPLLPAFVVLDGRVAIRKLCATGVDSASKKCIRKAVPFAVKAIFQRKVPSEDKAPEIVEGSLHGNTPCIVAPRSPFCARVDSESCLILDIDAAHNQHWRDFIERGRQSGAIKDID